MSRVRDRAAEGGQALVEFAVTVPLMVMVLLFSIWFYELVHVKLKVQEAARFLAWETTAYAMHDYSAGLASTLPIPQASIPGIDLGSLGVNAPYGLDAAASKQINSQINSQINNIIPFGGFGKGAAAVAAASAETMLRYRDMNSATLLPQATDMLAASWDQPIAFGIDQMEEPVYGGPLINLIVGLGGALVDIFSSMTFTDNNRVVTGLLRAGKDMGGARSARIFGAPEWGFNRRGYIKSMVAVVVNNEWFQTGVGKMILPNAGVLLRETNGVLADSWRLNKDSLPGLDQMNIGFGTSPLNEQVSRMYMVNRRARLVAWKAFVVELYGYMTTVLGEINATVNAPSMDTFTKASAISRPYKNLVGGKVTLLQDMPTTGIYDTAPMRGAYRETLQQRGKNFMGCQAEMSLGCTDSLSQDNPFGDYIVR